jgi:hypothetical protein
MKGFQLAAALNRTGTGLTHPNSAALTEPSFIDALLMATAVEVRVQEHFDAFFRHRFADHSPAHRQNIRVIMLAAQPRAVTSCCKRATDMRMAVGGDRNADARSADQNAASGLAGLDGIGQLAGEIGIVDGLGAIWCPNPATSHRAKRLSGFLEGKAPVITSDGYSAF